MRAIVLPTLALIFGTPAQAQWLPWAQDAFGERPIAHERRLDEPREKPSISPGEAVRDGGMRPHIHSLAPDVVTFIHDYPVSSIVIDTSARRLYYVLGNAQAYAYPISVGREGFTWTGSETISRKQLWPDWYPPEEMRQRDPKLPVKMTGGLRNPLGAVALYLGETLYRIHGTNDVKSIGLAQSSGCFRMMNAHVVHLAAIADIGTPVAVVAALPKAIEVSAAPRSDPRDAGQPAPAGPSPMPPQDDRALRNDLLRR